MSVRCRYLSEESIGVGCSVITLNNISLEVTVYSQGLSGIKYNPKRVPQYILRYVSVNIIVWVIRVTGFLKDTRRTSRKERGIRYC